MNKNYFQSRIDDQKRIIEGLKHSIFLIRQQMKGCDPSRKAGHLKHIEEKKIHILKCNESIKRFKEDLKKAPK
jgi:hypothetical protein